MPDNFKHIVEVSFRLAFTPKALTAIAVVAVTLLTLVFKLDVDWARLISLLPALMMACFIIGFTLNLSPVPTDFALPGEICVVESQYARAGVKIPEGAKYV